MFNKNIRVHAQKPSMTISNLPDEIIGNILSYLNLKDVITFMRTNKINYQKTAHVLQSPKHFNLDKNTKYSITITDDDIDEDTCQPKNLKLMFLPYLFIDIKSKNNIKFIEKYYSLINCNISLNFMSIKNFSRTLLLNNVISVTFKDITFAKDFKLTNDSIKYLQITNCNITNEMICDIKHVEMLYIEKCNTFTTFDNNNKTNNVVISKCKNFTHFGNINCKIIEIIDIDSVDFSSLVKNKSSIGKLQIVNCNLTTISNLLINNMSIISCNINNINAIHNIERLKLLGCVINSITNMSNINNLIIDNCVSYNDIIISNIKNIRQFSMTYVIRDPSDISFTPNFRFRKLKNIKTCELNKIKISEIELDTCENLSIKTYSDINSFDHTYLNINNSNIKTLNMY